MNKKINVLFIVPSLRVGGAERQVIDLVNNLSREAFDIHLLTFEKNLDLYENLRTEGIQFHQALRKKKYDFSVFRKVAVFIDAHDIDIVHGTLQISALFGLVGKRLSRKRPKFIAAVHTTKNRNLKDEFFDWFLYAPLLFFSNAIITVSDNQRRRWSRKFPWLKTKLVTIHNGVDTQKFADTITAEGKTRLRASLGIGGAEFIACILADLRPEKGHEFAFQALKRLMAAGYPARLMIIGDGERKDQLQKLAEELSLSNRILWLGRQKDPRSYISVADCLLAASWAESFPLSILEALSMGKPVIATLVGGIPEIIHDGLNGILVPPRDVDALFKALRTLISDEHLRRKLPAHARDSVLEKFTVEGMAAKTGELLIKWARSKMNVTRPEENIDQNKIKEKDMNGSRDRCRILLFSPSFKDPGGVAAFCRLLMKNISPAYKVDHFEIGNRPGNKNPVRQIFFFIGDSFRLLGCLRKNKYDLVHLNPSLEILSLFRDSFYLWLISRVFKIKNLVLFHGWNVRIARRIASNRPGRSFFRSLYEKTDRILVLCRAYKEQLGRMGLAPTRIEVITTMYQAEEIGGGESIRNGSSPVQILFMGRLLRAKGVYIAAEVARLLVEDGTTDFRLVFAGDGPEMEGIRKYRDEFGLKDYIQTPGYLKDKEKRTVLEGSDVFLYPTYYGEGCPIVVLEAMGAGLAVVSTPTAAIAEVVENGKNGFLIESLEAKDFMLPVKRLINNPGLVRRVRTANKEKSLVSFEARVVTQKIESIYSSILLESAGPEQGMIERQDNA